MQGTSASAGRSTGRADGLIVVTAVNLGDASADPAIEPIVLADKLPSGLKAVAIEGYADEGLSQDFIASAGMHAGVAELHVHG